MNNGAWTSDEVDLDALADYTAGVLADDEAATVAELITADPAWRSAYDALVVADAAVLADLHAAAAMSLAMPDDVRARIDAALAAEPRSDAVVIPIDAARSRRRRFATAITAAAAAVIAVAGGLTVAGSWPVTSRGSTMAEAPAAGDAAAPEAGAGGPLPSGALVQDPSTVRVVASGRDYSNTNARDVAGEEAAVAPAVPAAGTQSPSGAAKYSILADTDVASRMAGGELARLVAPAALEACLRMIAAAVLGAPAVVDYARFAGAPALVILMRQATTSTIVVVGPDCGLTDLDLVTTLPA